MVEKKNFRLRKDQIRSIATNRGGCIASDRITVDGVAVGYMYRECPHNDLDSGWRFLAGDESEQYMADKSKHEIYDINTIANYDPSIIPYLDAPEGTEFERDQHTWEWHQCNISDDRYPQKGE